MAEGRKNQKQPRASLESRVSPWRKLAAFDQFCSEMSPSAMPCLLGDLVDFMAALSSQKCLGSPS